MTAAALRILWFACRACDGSGRADRESSQTTRNSEQPEKGLRASHTMTTYEYGVCQRCGGRGWLVPKAPVWLWRLRPRNVASQLRVWCLDLTWLFIWRPARWFSWRWAAVKRALAPRTYHRYGDGADPGVDDRAAERMKEVLTRSPPISGRSRR